ncbi:MAG: hypothetical protein ABMA02_09655 [Saprospiraceae bacterium]
MQYDTNKYKIYTWKSGVMLHWVLNPGLAINEVILGQRVPKVSLIDKTSDKPYMDRGFVPCPHCSHLHPSLTWSAKNNLAFGNWFGLYCHKCGGIIPCLMNALSFILLVVTAPLWWWFRDSLRAAWLTRQPARYADLDLSGLTYTKTSWLAMGLTFGVVMFSLQTILPPLISKVPFTTDSIVTGLIIAALAGLVFGLAMKLWMGRRGKGSGVSD